ncbi:hypothetical protein [Bacillus sp. B-jedd]|uniref:hypothetical protein n=1 Tax=Bacillus sp. B-jedd TaxID=1476857 RepID=UPI0005155E6C|nr:hypothetical protein [Bacillus sp. B-jedd]CEG29337.1 hypothetical protein BN1002_04272 [Bacillus sp. B-jedd]
MKKLFSGLAAGALAMGILASSAFAAVTIDPVTGAGFAGKGDVQTALGWNNADLQKNADTLKFTYVTETKYEVTVSWITGEGTRGMKTHEVTHNRTSSVDAVVGYDARNKKQVTGFILNKFDSVTSSGEIPKVGDEYPGNSGHIVESVELVSTTGGLYVNGILLQ